MSRGSRARTETDIKVEKEIPKRDQLVWAVSGRPH